VVGKNYFSLTCWDIKLLRIFVVSKATKQRHNQNKMKEVTLLTARELKLIIATGVSIAIEGHPVMVGLEASNNHAHYYSASDQGEVYIKFPVNVFISQ